jgi:hypothetical protein
MSLAAGGETGGSAIAGAGGAGEGTNIAPGDTGSEVAGKEGVLRSVRSWEAAGAVARDGAAGPGFAGEDGSDKCGSATADGGAGATVSIVADEEGVGGCFDKAVSGGGMRLGDGGGAAESIFAEDEDAGVPLDKAGSDGGTRVGAGVAGWIVAEAEGAGGIFVNASGCVGTGAGVGASIIRTPRD